MYQFYYARKRRRKKSEYKHDIRELFCIEKIRLSVWEEHCLECAAPECYKICSNYKARSDGRCKLLINGMETVKEPKGTCGYLARMQFRKWANIMSIAFPYYEDKEQYIQEYKRHKRNGVLRKIVLNSFLPLNKKWDIVHESERKERKQMREKVVSNNIAADAFLLHCYSYYDKEFNLILEVYDKHEPLYRTSFLIKPGENIEIKECLEFSEACWAFNNLIKIYPENNIEVEMDFLWCDFVKGHFLNKERDLNKIKCVVWDLDNTIWDGVFSECEEPTKLNLRENIYDVIKELDLRGILQSVSSKNNADECLDYLKEIGLSQFFLYPKICWGAKSESIKQIAQELNIGLESIALFDDSAFERGEVLCECKDVRVYDVEDLLKIIDKPEFDVPVTIEGKERRKMYQVDEKRRIFQRENHVDNIDFLKECKIELRFVKLTDERIRERCYELVQRTNQLNMSGRRYLKQEFEQIVKNEEYISIAIECKDRFGSYGIVGYLRYKNNETELIVVEFALSCRVACKYLESKIFSELLVQNKLDLGRMVVAKTKKNVTLRNSLLNCGFYIENDNEIEIEYSFSPDLKYKEIIEFKCE